MYGNREKRAIPRTFIFVIDLKYNHLITLYILINKNGELLEIIAALTVSPRRQIIGGQHLLSNN